MACANLTADVRAALLRAVRKGAPPDVAAAVAGVALRTWYHWRQQGRDGVEPYASLEADVQQAEAEQEINYVARIAEAGQKDWKANAWLLERSKPQRWAANREPERMDERRPVPAWTGDPWLEGDEE